MDTTRSSPVIQTASINSPHAGLKNRATPMTPWLGGDGFCFEPAPRTRRGRRQRHDADSQQWVDVPFGTIEGRA